ncbi:MAG TPA: rhomboid family intramembrane serine protease [Longimicrobiaceae bacterium]
MDAASSSDAPEPEGYPFPLHFAGDPDGPKPPFGPYGWVEKGALWAGDRRALEARFRKPHPPARVWTPEGDRLVPPWQVPWLFEMLKAPGLEKMRERLKAAGFVLALFTAITLMTLAGDPGALSHGPPIILVLVGVTFAQGLFEYRKLKALTPAEYGAMVEEVHTLPEAREGEPVFTRALAAVIAAVGVAQVLSPGSSAEAAGLVKDAVRNGEWWRLFTAPLLHGGPLHIVMNGTALLALGGLVERYAHRAFVPLVFLVTALAGGGGSFLAFPHKTSVGASGGIMGLVGFALVLSLRRRELLPSSLSKDLLADVGWIALMGLAAWQYIDNGAHAAGLAAGIALGALLVPRGGTTPHWEPAPAVRAAGWIAAAVIVASAITAAAAMFGML